MTFQRQLDEFNQKLDVAEWYLGVSTHQEEVIFSMHEKLRDDFEQASGTSMFQALVRLGIKPVIPPAKIKRMVQLSRNNILAFLFFVLEGYYKTCRKDGEYSINEQLLMIAIAKIDLLPTLRGLDAILPAPKLHPLEIKALYRAANAQMNSQVHATASPVTTEAPAKKPSKKSPYFQSQPKPVQRLSKLTTDIPDFVVNFNFWPNNALPNYGEEADEPWFAQYRLNPGQRLIKKTLSETLERYFKLGSIEGKKDDEDGPKSREPEPNMCLIHKAQVVQSQLLRDELAVKARDRCLELIDITQPYSRLRRARIVAQLEHDIDLIMDRHRRAMQCDQTKVLTVENADCVLCQHMLVSQPWPEPDGHVGLALVGEDTGIAHTAAIDTYRGRRLEGGGGKPKKNAKDKGKDKAKDKGKKGKKKKAKKVPEPPEPPIKIPKFKPPPRKLRNEPFRITNIDFKEKLQKCTQPPAIPECEKPPAPRKTAISFAVALGKIRKRAQKCDMQAGAKRRNKKKFFRAPRWNKPYEFKYHRVFQSGQPRPFDLNRIMAKSFVKALTKSNSDPEEPLTLESLLSELRIEEEVPPASDKTEPDKQSQSEPVKRKPEPVKVPEPELDMLMDPFDEEHTENDSRDTLDRSSNHSRRSHVDHKAEIVEAVVWCAKTIWQKQVAIKRAKMERQERLTQRNALTFKPGEKFDPDDGEQMNRLLKDGLRVLRQDPRYVLASLPNSHKLPVLREWVKRRYGKAYSQKELDASILESTRIFELVTLVQSNIPPIDLKGLDRLRRSEENFDNYEMIKKRASAVKRDLHNELNDRFLNTMSAAWNAMGNYLVPGGPPRRTFFAYIPSNPQEIMRNKTWNGDFRNYRAMRDRRKEMEIAMGKTED